MVSLQHDHYIQTANFSSLSAKPNQSDSNIEFRIICRKP